MPRKNMLRVRTPDGGLPYPFKDILTFTNASGEYTFDMTGKNFVTNDVGGHFVFTNIGDTHTCTDWAVLDGGSGTKLTFFISTLDGTEGVCTSSGFDREAVGIVFVIDPDYDDVITNNPEFDNGSTLDPDPPATADSVATSTLILAGMGQENLYGGDATPPAGYTHVATVEYDGTAQLTASLAFKIVTSSGIEDPGAFDGSPSTADWNTVTKAIPPAP